MARPIRLQRLLTHLFIILFGFCMLYPVLWMISSSFKPESHIFSQPGLLPHETTLQNYVKGWHVVRDQTFATFFKNSFIISSLCVIANLATCSMAAYAFGRMNFRFRKLWFACMLTTIMLPAHVTLIPRYAIFHYLDWVNTILPLTVPKFLATDTFFIFLMVQFIRGLPKDLDESATI
ncbi:carbohydrate ABC transporter permease, partial [Paenibacillus sepulcri]|nr:carbohydrate ABC transporter permease [Paenibacillus sepulcri]